VGQSRHLGQGRSGPLLPPCNALPPLPEILSLVPPKPLAPPGPSDPPCSGSWLWALILHTLIKVHENQPWASLCLWSWASLGENGIPGRAGVQLLELWGPQPLRGGVLLWVGRLHQPLVPRAAFSAHTHFFFVSGVMPSRHIAQQGTFKDGCRGQPGTSNRVKK
jgi:hypothetical protein